ncbi:hypothetical protein [Paenibacillus herberti]|uniref:hypothetical protein n=1 Tax=Paenibacillus herberti TaxID=1619309 RepID=UPI001595EEB1|nr:hypothetical protein [Paenibacillus herberti]
MPKQYLIEKDACQPSIFDGRYLTLVALSLLSLLTFRRSPSIEAWLTRQAISVEESRRI